MKTAIIGLGNIGSRVAKNLVAGGESIIVAGRDLAKTKAFAKTLGGETEAMSITDAVKSAPGRPIIGTDYRQAAARRR